MASYRGILDVGTMVSGIVIVRKDGCEASSQPIRAGTVACIQECLFSQLGIADDPLPIQPVLECSKGESDKHAGTIGFEEQQKRPGAGSPTVMV